MPENNHRQRLKDFFNTLEDRPLDPTDPYYCTFLQDSDADPIAELADREFKSDVGTLKSSLKDDPSFKQRLQQDLKGHVAKIVSEANQFAQETVELIRKKTRDADKKVVVLVDSVEQIRGVGAEGSAEVHSSVQNLFSGHAARPGAHGGVPIQAAIIEQTINHIRWEMLPMIILVPHTYKSRLREIAPDLLSVRSYTDELLPSPSLAKNITDTESTQSEYSVPRILDFDKHALKAIEIREWQRIQNQQGSDSELLRVGWRAFDVALKVGAWSLAEAINQVCVPIARSRVKASGETPETLCDLSISLENVGKMEEILGRDEVAYEVYRESLILRRQLLQSLGETPEILRNLSISLNNVGNMEYTLGRCETAIERINECLRYLKWLRTALPKDKRYPPAISAIEKKLALWQSSND